ncbi:peptide MFS transporter [Pseudofrancisella aestuarii]|uniref:Peptide MFS transporter n=1 Tax=Pseudofrancisella aestuarii TaxID=2670347 RepID=A0ABV9TDP1_9GAMM|nr:peptide MFS transporter [Pseudofrancisella aestuarii]
MELVAPTQTKFPKGMVYLFLTGLWERFSYYGITALLILYLFKFFGMSDAKAYLIYGAYASMVYGTPIIGGLIADKYIGQYRSIIIGASLIALGHFVMIVPDSHNYYFFSGLSFVIVGTGLFKPSIGAITGSLFVNSEYKRNEGFTLLYIGMNLGTIIAPIVCSYIAIAISWNLAFGVAGVGMLVGLVIFIKGGKHYKDIKTSNIKKTAYNYPFWVILSTFICGLILFVFVLLVYPVWASRILYLIGLSTLFLISYFVFKSEKYDRSRIYITVTLTFFYMIFMILLQQSGGMLNVFTERNVNREILGFVIPTSAYQSVEPFFIIFFGPIYALLGRRFKNNTNAYPAKFATGLLVMSTSFLVLVLAISLTAKEGFISSWWINLSYMLQAAGELFIGPIGLAMVSAVAPKKMVGFFMGVWVLSSAFANFLAASFGALISGSQKAGSIAPTETIDTYFQAFIYFTLLGLVAALVLFALSPYLNKKLRAITI